MALLGMKDVRGGYGDADILHGVSMTVGEREVVVIVGPNGAGKSTAMKSVFGLLTIRGGSIVFDGEDITGWAPDRIVQRGICYVPQVDNVFREMTVHENFEMGAFLRRATSPPPTTASTGSSPTSRPSAATSPATSRAASARWWRWGVR